MTRICAPPVMLCAVLLAGCGRLATQDKYDPSRIELKSPIAKSTSDRHTGPFASGASINTTAALRPLDSAVVKEVRLDTTRKRPG